MDKLRYRKKESKRRAHFLESTEEQVRHGEKVSEPRALTNWKAEREEQVRTSKEMAGSAHFLSNAKRGTGQGIKRKSERRALTNCWVQRVKLVRTWKKVRGWWALTSWKAEREGQVPVRRGHQKKARERGALTGWTVKKEGSFRMPNKSKGAKCTHIL
jgi:hypothetical protein